MTLKAAEEAGVTKGTFYRALDLLGVERFEEDGRKWLRLTPDLLPDSDAKGEQEGPAF